MAGPVTWSFTTAAPLPPPPTGGALANVSLTAGWATFGEALPDGAAWNGLQIGSLVTQTDVKTTWPDGSIRYAIISAYVPANSIYPITAAAPPTGTFTPRLPNASVQFNFGGTTYTATLPSMPSSDTWLGGPLVVEDRYVVIPAQSDGTPHSFLDVIFDVRTYSDGTSRIDVTVENVLDQSDAARVSYSVYILANGQALYHHDTFDHYWGTRWRKVFDIGLTESQVTLDFTPFYQAKAIPQYMSIVANTVSSPTGPNFDILQAGDLTTDMTSHGGRAELAPYPDWTSLSRSPGPDATIRCTRERRSFRVLACPPRQPNGPTSPGGPTYQGLGSGRLLSIDERPDFWYDNRGYRKHARRQRRELSIRLRWEGLPGEPVGPRQQPSTLTGLHTLPRHGGSLLRRRNEVLGGLCLGPHLPGFF